MLGAACVVLTACEHTPHPDDAAVAVRDSGDVQIVENRPTPETALDSFERVALIGTVADEWFYQIGGVTRMSSGVIVVADNANTELRFYQPPWDKSVRRVGGMGSGPVEFEQIDGVFRFSADSLAVWDARLARLTVLDSSGLLIRTVRPVPQPRGSYFPVVGVFEDGSFIATDGIDIGAIFSQGTGVHRGTQTLLRYSPAGSLRDTLVTLPADERFAWVEGDGFSLRPLPYGQRTFIQVSDRRFYTSTGGDLGIVGYASSGRKELIGRIRGTLDRVTHDDIAYYRRQALSSIGTEDVPRERRRLEEIVFPEFKAPVSGMVAGQDGSLWLREVEAADKEVVPWAVFSTEGHACARVHLPMRLSVRSIGSDWLLAVETDSLEVQRVALYRFEPLAMCATAVSPNGPSPAG